MCDKLDQILARHCAPTLAGIKPGNLVSCAAADYADIGAEITGYNSLNAVGVYFDILCHCNNRFLLYVYRPLQLLQHLWLQDRQQILRQAGYPETGSLTELLAHLKARFQAETGFPHEIGLFLGYPPEDVLGFQQHKGKNYRLNRYWKVYGDVEAAQKLFARYDSCRRAVCRRVEDGASITEIFGPPAGRIIQANTN